MGTVCYELLIGHEVFNAQTMVDLIKNLKEEIIMFRLIYLKKLFLSWIVCYNIRAKRRLSAEELSKHTFLTKNVKDFQKLDLRKVSHKVEN